MRIAYPLLYPPTRQLISIFHAQVTSDAAALELMNDSPYGLTASVWTDASNPESLKVFEDVFVDGIETGTVFLNRSVWES